MGKHEPMSAKAIAIKIKSKGLQKIKYYCEMCKKQCRDDNGFKCHIMSEAHQRQALIVSENPEKFVSEFSKEFLDGFMYLLRTRYRTKRVLANTVFQEYIKEKDHIHMNGTRWTTLTQFANWLGENNLAKVDESERGVMVTYIDKDPITLQRLEMEEKKALKAKEAAERTQKEIERQIELDRKAQKELDESRAPIEPIPIVKIPVHEVVQCDRLESSEDNALDVAGTSSAKTAISAEKLVPDTTELIERPVFQVQAITLKTSAPSVYKRPPPKRKVCGKSSVNKKIKST